MPSNNSESRKHIRHKIINTFIVNQESICQIFDLSSGGIGFRCTTGSKIPNSLNVDIFNNSGLHILNIPLKKVWLSKSKEIDNSSMYEVVLGAQFGRDLSQEQEAALDQMREFI